MGDGTWVMYDYHRGYDGRVEHSGMANVFRLPRYIYRFFQVQYRPDPAVFICSDWTPRPGRTKVVVFSNGDEVELILNGKPIRKQKPDSGPDTLYGDYIRGGNPWDGGNCRHLIHPPFTFFDVPYEPGELKAVAYRQGRKIAVHTVRTPGAPSAIRLRIDESGRRLKADGADCLFVYADIVDKRGSVCTHFRGQVKLAVQGPLRIVGPATMPVENGTASFLVQSTGGLGETTVLASLNAGIQQKSSIQLSR
jgi:beta-galactosidase